MNGIKSFAKDVEVWLKSGFATVALHYEGNVLVFTLTWLDLRGVCGELPFGGRR